MDAYWRLKAYNRLKKLKEPDWQKAKISENKLSRFVLFFSPKKHER